MKRFLVALGIFAVSFGGFMIASAPASASTPYTLTASGPWVSADGLLSGTWSAHFDLAGFDLSGTLDVIGMPGVGSGNIAGSWDLNNLGFGVMFLDQEVANFTGGIQGSQLVGTFEANGINGNWSGALDSLSLSSLPIAPILDSSLPQLLLNQTSGNIGDIVSLVASLSTLGAPIQQIENTINFDSIATPILALANGSPSCSVSSAVDAANSIFEFLPQGCSGSTCQQVHAIIQSLNGLPLPDGAQLYVCKVQIAATAAAGIYQFVSSALKAIDINNVQLPLSSISGQIGAKISWFKNIFRSHGCHCSTVATAGPLPLTSLLAPLLLLALRRRARNRTAERS